MELSDFFESDRLQESTEIISLDNVGDYFFVNTDECTSGRQQERIAQILVNMLKGYKQDNIIIYSPEGKYARGITSVLKNNGFEVEILEDLKHSSIKSNNGAKKDKTKELRKELENSLGANTIKHCFSGSRIHWLELRKILSQQKKNVKLWGITFKKDFLLSLEKDNVNLKQVLDKVQDFSEIQSHGKNWRNRIKEDRENKKGVTQVFIGNSDSAKLVNHAISQFATNSSHKRENHLFSEFFTQKTRTDGVIKCLHSFDKKSDEHSLEVKKAILLKNKLLFMLTSKRILFTKEDMLEVMDVVNSLERKYKSKRSIKPERETYRKLKQDILYLTKQVKNVQIWRVIGFVREQIESISSRKVAVNKDTITEKSNKRRTWGKTFIHQEDNPKELVVDIAHFLDSVIGRSTIESIEDILSYSPDKYIRKNTDKFSGPKLLEFIIVEILEATRSVKTHGVFRKGDRNLDLAAKTDFIFYGENNENIGYQLHVGNPGSRFAKTKVGQIKAYQKKVKQLRELGETSITSTSEELGTIRLDLQDIPHKMVLCELCLNRDETRSVKEYYQEYEAGKQQHILDGVNDSLAHKIKMFSEAIQKIHQILYQNSQREFEKIFDGRIQVPGLQIQGYYKDFEDIVEINIVHSGKLLGKITLLDIGNLQGKFSEKKCSRGKKEKPSRKNGRSARTRRRWE